MAAVKATGRENLIMAGVTMEVCLAYPAMQTAAESFQFYGVIEVANEGGA